MHFLSHAYSSMLVPSFYASTLVVLAFQCRHTTVHVTFLLGTGGTASWGQSSAPRRSTCCCTLDRGCPRER
ncbi:hypothetical protein F5Y09DRAFT_311695 [Xylaria sp. FL1042]|nr:hypothetical protein F5Y09DRAFT_311695 [Xylaria sp. FL1042]